MTLNIGDGNFSGQMAASYVVEIRGIERTKSEIAKLSQAIQSIRNINFSGGKARGKSVTTLSRGGSNSALLVTKIDALEGRVQTKAIAAVNAGVKAGREAQIARLNAAITVHGIRRMAGRAGKRSGGGSAGRNRTGSMIKAVKSSVEVKKSRESTLVTGWHGWPNGVPIRFNYQEKGTRGSNEVLDTATRRDNKNTPSSGGGGRGIEAANSVGAGIIVAREEIKRGLKGLR